MIGSQDMDLILSVTDRLGIHRGSVKLMLSKEDPGSIVRTDSGTIEITVPETGPIQEFIQHLEARACGETS